MFPSIRLIWADQGYGGTLVTWAATSLNITLQIVRKLANQTGFVVLKMEARSASADDGGDWARIGSSHVSSPNHACLPRDSKSP